MMSFPILVVLKDLGRGVIDYSRITDSISRALQPYTTDFEVEEYAWVDGSIVASWLEEIAEVYDMSDTGAWDRSVVRYHMMAKKLWERYVYLRDHTMENPMKVFATEEMREFLDIMYPRCRWDPETEMMMTRRNPDGLLDSWSLSGIYANRYLTMDSGGVSGGLVRNIDLMRLNKTLRRALFTVVEWSEEGGSQLYARLTPVHGSFVVRCSMEEWVQQVRKIIEGIEDDDYLTVVTCRNHGH